MAVITALLALFCALQFQAQTPPLVGIAHVAFRVADLDQSRAFYRTLGFEQAFEFADDGKTSTVFIKINDNQFIELYPRSEDSEPLGLAHICFETNSLETLRTDYLRHRMKPSEIEKGRAGNLLFDLHDFEGQLLEYTQYLPDSLHSMDHGKHLDGRRVSQHLLEVTIPVRNIAAARKFYATKLRFEPISSGGHGTKLRLPGHSKDQIELASAVSTKTTRITFAVENMEHTATNLRRRGFKVRADANSASISDPNGNLIVFREVLRKKALSRRCNVKERPYQHQLFGLTFVAGLSSHLGWTVATANVPVCSTFPCRMLPSVSLLELFAWNRNNAWPTTLTKEQFIQ